MAKIKFVRAYFSGAWVSEAHQLFIDQFSVGVGPEYHWNRPKDFNHMSENEWKEFVQTEEFNKLPYLMSETFNISMADYIELLFHDKGRLTIHEKFEVETHADSQSLQYVINMIDTHVNLMEKSFKQLSEFSVQKFNEKVGVALHDNFLSNVNQTLLLEDCCSDYLQKHLSNGWRIISVCPQPTGRRPDYILGKTVEQPTTYALRGDQ